jgi:uncharacterized protein (TIGR00725 family)
MALEHAVGSGVARCTIGVIGSGGDASSATMLAAAEAVGLAIARHGASLITGGRAGVMEAASRGARSGGGLTIGILATASRDDANPYVMLAIPTGFGSARALTLVRSCDAIIVIGGGAGTLVELGLAYLEAKPIVVLRHTGGMADRIEGMLLNGCYLDERNLVPMHFAESAEAAVSLAMSLSAEAEEALFSMETQ